MEPFGKPKADLFLIRHAQSKQNLVATQNEETWGHDHEKYMEEMRKMCIDFELLDAPLSAKGK
jgi:hypothetical protein